MKLPNILLPPREAFMIVDTATGLSSSGGMEVKWKKRGKVWKTLGYLRSHISMLREQEEMSIRRGYGGYDPYAKFPYGSDAVVIYDVVNGKVLTKPKEYKREK